MKHMKVFLFILLMVLLSALPAQADVIPPEGTVEIEEQAFMNDTSLAGTLIIPAGVREIDAESFRNCTGLTGITFTDTPVIIDRQAFAGCTGLAGTTVFVPKGSTIAADAFDSTVTIVIADLNDYPPVVPSMIQPEHTTLTIYDWWSGSGERDLYPDETEQKIYAYHDWIESTYNVKIVQKGGGDWITNTEEMINFTTDPDGSLRMYIIEPGRVGGLIDYGIAASWGNYDLSAPKWNKSTIDLWTVGGQHYGVSAGAHEPRTLVYFNKRLLEEAGIDWNSIYDMQAAGTWTWSAFESLLKKTTRDTDRDGVIDVWGVSGNSDYMYLLAVLGNGGSFFDFDSNGALQPTMDSAASMAALNWGKKIQDTYWMLQPEGANWDWYKEAWKEGKFTFYINEAYCGFNAWSEMRDMEDEWGAVAFPVPSAGNKYITNPSENTALIPNVYDAETVRTIAFFYDLWTNDAPGVNSGDSWRSGLYGLTDERAVDETYGMLRKASHGVADKFVYLGTLNDILGSPLLWGLASSSPAELIDAAMPAWEARCDNFNHK